MLQTERSSDGTQLTEAPTAPAGSDRPDGRQNASSVPTQPATQPAVQVLIDSRGRQIVIASETGCGVVPIDPLEEERREAAGRLSCKLAASADVVIRVVCGIPCFLKGNL